jgi:hypothetical protein
MTTSQSGGGLGALFAELVVDAVNGARAARLERQARQAIREAKREAKLAEQRANERQRAWLRLMQRQARERWAGDASRDDARRLLGGASGRRNPLDSRKFRALDERKYR